MKVQEVLLRAMAKKISWWQAAEIIGVSARTMRRWRERLEEDGYDGLADRRKGVVSPKRVSLEVCERVLGLYRERYLRPEHTAFPRKAAGRTRNRVELHVGAKSAARGGSGSEAKQAWNASQKAADARHAATYRWKQALLVSEQPTL